MIRNIVKKSKSNKGFTITEVLCATIILVLVALMVGSAMNVSMSAYTSKTTAAETQALLALLSNTIANELRFCKDSKVISGADPANVEFKTRTYSGTPARSMKFVIDGDGELGIVDSPVTMLKPYKVLSAMSYGSGNIPKATYKMTDLVITREISNRTVTFKVEIGVKRRDDKGAGATVSFYVRQLTPQNS